MTYTGKETTRVKPLPYSHIRKIRRMALRFHMFKVEAFLYKHVQR